MAEPKKPKTRGKGKSKVERLHALLVKHSLDLFRKGRPVIDPATGMMATNTDGLPVMVPPTAADLTAATKILTMKVNPQADTPFKRFDGMSMEEEAELRLRLRENKPPRRNS